MWIDFGTRERNWEEIKGNASDDHCSDIHANLKIQIKLPADQRQTYITCSSPLLIHKTAKTLIIYTGPVLQAAAHIGYLVPSCRTV